MWKKGLLFLLVTALCVSAYSQKRSKAKEKGNKLEFDLLYGLSLPIGPMGSTEPEEGRRAVTAFLEPASVSGLSARLRFSKKFGIALDLTNAKFEMDRDAYLEYMVELNRTYTGRTASYENSELPVFTATTIMPGIFLQFGDNQFNVQTHLHVGVLYIRNTPLNVIPSKVAGTNNYSYRYHDSQKFIGMVSPGVSARLQLHKFLHLVVSETLHYTRYGIQYQIDPYSIQMQYFTLNSMIGLGFRF